MPSHRRAALCALVLASALHTAPALAQSAASSFSKSATDPTTGSTAASGGAAGNTRAGDTINWVLHYRNDTGAVANVDLEDPIAGNQTYVPGSLKVPPGMARRWSTDGGTTFQPVEPANGVDAVGATGQNVDGSTGNQVVTQPGGGGFNVGNVGGDGWEALFIGDNVYNVHHHFTPPMGTTVLDCHVKATGATCPGFPAGGTYVSETAGTAFGTGPNTLATANQPSGAADANNGRIYFPVGVYNTKSVGVACAEVTTRTSCGYTELDQAMTTTGPGAYPPITGGATIGTKYYLMGELGQIYCFDYAAGSPCPGFPISAAPGRTTTSVAVGSDSILEAYDNRYLFANLQQPSATNANVPRDLLCFDTIANAICPGFPKVAYGGLHGVAGNYNSTLVPLLSATGTVTGICAEASPDGSTATFKCFDLAGNPVPTPWTQQVPGALVNWPGYGSIERIGTKVYFAESLGSTTAATYTCFDFATGAPCAGFTKASTGAPVQAYTLRQDPYKPDCIWVVGNSGIFEVFSATFGGTTCDVSQASVTINPADYYCDGAGGHATGWRDVRIGSVTDADYTAMSITISDANGVPIPGWQGRVYPNTQRTIDISSIPNTGDTAQLGIAVVFSNLAPNVNPTLNARFNGDPVQVCFQTVVGPPACATTIPITNEANVVTVVPGGTSDAPGGNDSGVVTFQEASDKSVCRADLELRKSARSSPGVPGADLTYDLVVTNHGPDAAENLVVTDDVPAGTTFVSASAGCTESAGVVSCRQASLANGATTSFEVTIKLASSALGEVTNDARVDSDTVDPNQPNNPDSEKVPLEPRADLGIEKTPSSPTVTAGGSVLYTLVVTNHGPSDATGVKVVDEPPATLTLTSATPGQGTCSTDGGKLACDVGALAQGASMQILVGARIAAEATGSIDNTAGVDGNEPDPNPDNDKSTATVTIPTRSQQAPAANLEIVKRASRGVVAAGQSITYTVVVTNRGPGTATGVKVTDTPGLAVSVTSAKATAGTCTTSTPLTCSLGTIEPNAQVTITIVARPRAAGTLRNSATVTSEQPDPDASNNTAAASTRVRGALRLSKTADRKSVASGGRVTYRITVRNPGAVALHDVRVCDRLPAGLAYASSTGRAKLTKGQRCWSIATLAAGRSVSYRLTARALQGGGRSRTNVATATSPDASTQRAKRAVRVLAGAVRSGGVTG